MYNKPHKSKGKIRMSRNAFTFEARFIAKIEEFLKSRIKAYDELRLAKTTFEEYISVEEAYQQYRKLNKENRGKNCIRNYKYSIPIGKKVFFKEAEKEKIFAIIREYLIKTPIKDYFDSRDDFDFIIDIIEAKFKEEKISNKEKIELSKFLVSLNCIKDYLSFENEWASTVSNSYGNFYIEDHRRNKFLNYDVENPKNNYIGNFPPLKHQMYLRWYKLKNKETGESISFFGTHNEDYSSFIDGKKYTRKEYNCEILNPFSIYFYTIPEYSFLKKELCDPKDLEDMQKVWKLYLSLPKEEKEELDRLTNMGAHVVLGRYLKAKGFSEKINDIGKEEVLFKNAIQDELKYELLNQGFCRLFLENTSTRILNRARNKSTFSLVPICDESVIVTWEYVQLERKGNYYTYYQRNQKLNNSNPKR